MDAELATGDLAAVPAGAWVLLVAQGPELGPVARALDAAATGALAQAVGDGGMVGRFGQRRELTLAGTGLAAGRAVLIGVGALDQLDGYRLRNALELAVRGLDQARVAVALEPAVVAAVSDRDGIGPADVARVVAEGAGRATGEWSARGRHRAAFWVETVIVAGLGDLDPAAAAAALRAGAQQAEAANRVREWQWRPANQLTPATFADEAASLARESGLEAEVLDGDHLKGLRMGALLGVAQGSREAPRVLVLRYRADPQAPTLGLVGKGITFDAGGISLKPPALMHRMKADMSGAAAVAGAMSLIGRWRPPVNVLAVMLLTENLPGGGALKPGDCLTALGGQTIEVTNTDAEGRLVLADGLGYAAHLGATHLVSVATLTGAVEIALGHPVTAAMTNDPALLERVRHAGRLAGERVWELPMFPEYDVCLDSDVADMVNAAESRAAGTINGAVFLREFVDQRPWVHLDIAAAAYNFQANLVGQVPKGPTGVMTATLAHLPALLSG